MHYLVPKNLLSLCNNSAIFLNIADHTSTSLPYIPERRGEGSEGKELQHDKAKTTCKKVICEILLYLYRSVPDFGKIH